jgi:hypothetical protein
MRVSIPLRDDRVVFPIANLIWANVALPIQDRKVGEAKEEP